MKKLRNALLLTVWCLAVVCGRAADYGYLTLTKADGSSISYPLGSVRMTFNLSENSMTVVSAKGTSTLPLKQLSKMNFTEQNVGIHSARQENTPLLLQTGDVLSVTLQESAALHLYTIDGRLVLQRKLTQGQQKVDLGSLPSAVYLIKIGERTFKISKQ